MSVLQRDDVHLIDYLRVLYKRRVFVVIVLALAIGSTILSTSRQTPIYQSSARILVDNVNTLVDFPGVERYRRMVMDTELHLMRSLEVAEHAAATRLRPDLERGDPKFEALVAQLRRSTSVKTLRNTLIVDMSVRANQPEKARDWAEAMSSSYVELNFESTKQSNMVGAAAMREEIEKTQRQLEIAERKLLDFKNEHLVVSDWAKRAEQENIYGSGSNSKAAADIKRTEAQQKYEALKRWHEGNDFSLPLPQDLVPSPLVTTLYTEIVSKRTELQALSLKYRPKHPKVREVRAALETAKRNFDREIQAGLAVLKKQIELWGGIGEAHEERNTQQKRKFLDQNELDWQYRVLQRNVDVKEEIYRTLLTRLGELNVAGSIVRNNVRVIERPKVRPFPVYPRWKFNLLVGLAFGLAVAVAGVFFLEYLDKTLKTPDDVARYLDLPVLAVVPMSRPELLKAPYEPPKLREGDSARGASAA